MRRSALTAICLQLSPCSERMIHWYGSSDLGALSVRSSLAWLGFATRGDATPDVSPPIVHDVTVSYMYETDPGTAEGNESKRVASIQFFPGYVVIASPTGECELFSVDRLRRFSFTPTNSDEDGAFPLKRLR